MGSVSLGAPEGPDDHYNLASPSRGGSQRSTGPALDAGLRAALARDVTARSLAFDGTSAVVTRNDVLMSFDPTFVSQADRIWVVTLQTSQTHVVVAVNYSIIDGKLVFFGPEDEVVNEEYLEADVVDVHALSANG